MAGRGWQGISYRLNKQKNMMEEGKTTTLTNYQ